MKPTPSLLILTVVFACRQMAAAAEEDPARVAQTYYDGYMKVLNADGDTRRYVLKSDRLTPAFKQAYTAAMKEPEADLIIQGQDFPKAGFKSSAPKLKASIATVTMTSRDTAFKHSFKVTLVKNAESWLIAGIGNFKGK